MGANASTPCRGLQVRSFKAPIIAVVAISFALAFYSFLASYFLDDPLRWERVILASLALSVLARKLWASRMLRVTPLNAAVLSALMLVMALNHFTLRSLSLTNASFLLVLLAVADVFGGRDILRWAIRPVAAMAFLAYPPRAIFASVVDELLVLVIASSRGLISAVDALFARGLESSVVFTDRAVYVLGSKVDFVTACSGYHFMMVYISFVILLPCLDRAEPTTPSLRTLGHIIGAAALAYLLNAARIVTMLLLATSGHWDLALGSGHEALGHAFITAGFAVIVLWLRNPGPTPSGVASRD